MGSFSLFIKNEAIEDDEDECRA